MRAAPALDLHPMYRGARHTVQGIFEERADAAEAAARHVKQGRVIIEYETTAPSGRTLHVIAARTYAVRRRRARIPQDHTVPWQAVRIALEAFRSAERNAAARGAPLRWYKPLEEEKLRDALMKLEFHGSRLDVASRMMSRLIVAHPFPNANHRTSISLARTFLASEGEPWPHYSLRGRGIDRFIRETEPHIVRSKYFLQLRRRMPLVKVAYGHGYRALEVKEGAVIPIAAEDVTLSPQDVVMKHEAACRHLFTALADEGGGLALPATRGWREFVAWYFHA